jgi:flagellar motor switch protein FliN/FliY
MTEHVEHEEAKEPKDTEKPAGAPTARAGTWNIDLLLDVELPISVSFGHSEMPLKDVMKLGTGSVIELDKAVNDPVTLVVNHKPIAKGEVVMVDGKYGVRILDVESTADRIRSLG